MEVEEQNGDIQMGARVNTLPDGILWHVKATAKEVRQALLDGKLWRPESKKTLIYKKGVAVLSLSGYRRKEHEWHFINPPKRGGTLLMWAFVEQGGSLEPLVRDTAERAEVAQQAWVDLQALCQQNNWKVTLQIEPENTQTQTLISASCV